MNNLIMFQFSKTLCGIDKVILLSNSVRSSNLIRFCDVCLSFDYKLPNMEHIHKDRRHFTRELIRGGGLEQLMGRVFVEIKTSTNLFTTWEVNDIISPHQLSSLDGSRMIEVNLDIIPHHLRFDTLSALCNL